MAEPLLIRYMQPLLAGRRRECFELVEDALERGEWTAEAALCDLVWPAIAQIERLYRDDRINVAVENMAYRINRTVADQLQARLPSRTRNGKRVLVSCADEVREEVGAQMVGDLLQADGWEVYFVGGGVPNDETLALVGALRPDVLLIFGTKPQAVPEVRGLVAMIREIGVCPTMNIIVSGGIYNRADGLWQEVGADVLAETARDALRIANELEPRAPQPMPRGIVKRRRRRRRPTAPPPVCAVT